MRTLAFLLAAVAAAGCGGSSRKPSSTAAGDLDPALEACARGDLDAAEALLREGRDPESIRLRARILMMKNRNREAIELLSPLLQGKSTDYESMERRTMLLPDLALAHVRQDSFQHAARIYAAMGESILAKKYDGLGRVVAYSSDLPENEVAVDFYVADPLPIVAGSVNGRRALFVIDTMLDQLTLDHDFARSAGIEPLGVRAIGAVDEATVKEVGVGRAIVRNVPVHLNEAAKIGDLRPAGSIGLQFLMHFDFTLDYRRGRLVLRKAGGTLQGQPAFVVGDRYLLIGGTMNGKDRIFIGIGSGLKGVTLAASELFLQNQPGDVREIAAGPMKLIKPALDLKTFPSGLDGAFGIPVGFVLGHSALRGRVLRLEPYSMRVLIE